MSSNNSITASIKSVQAFNYKLYNGQSLIISGTIPNKIYYLLVTVPLTDLLTTYIFYLYIDSSLSIGMYNSTL